MKPNIFSIAFNYLRRPLMIFPSRIEARALIIGLAADTDRLIVVPRAASDSDFTPVEGAHFIAHEPTLGASAPLTPYSVGGRTILESLSEHPRTCAAT